jgi:hypothetical protein
MNRNEFDALTSVIKSGRGPKTRLAIIEKAFRKISDPGMKINRGDAQEVKGFIDRLFSIRKDLVKTGGDIYKLARLHVTMNGAATANVVRATMECLETGDSPSKVALKNRCHSSSVYKLVERVNKLKSNYDAWERTL